MMEPAERRSPRWSTRRHSDLLGSDASVTVGAVGGEYPRRGGSVITMRLIAHPGPSAPHEQGGTDLRRSLATPAVGFDGRTRMGMGAPGLGRPGPARGGPTLTRSSA